MLCYSTLGDAAHVVTLLNAVAFLGVVGLYAGDKDSSFLFDEAWKNDGFCVAGKAKSYWSSHDVCLYMDFVLATGFAVLFVFLRKTAGLEAANKFIVPGIVGIVAHGIGHGAIARGMRDEDDIEKLQDNIQRPFSERLREESVSTILSEELPFFIFWIGLIYAAMPQSKKSVIFLVSLISHIGNGRIPIHLKFTFVQVVPVPVLFPEANQPPFFGQEVICLCNTSSDSIYTYVDGSMDRKYAVLIICSGYLLRSRSLRWLYRYIHDCLVFSVLCPHERSKL